MEIYTMAEKKQNKEAKDIMKVHITKCTIVLEYLCSTKFSLFFKAKR